MDACVVPKATSSGKAPPAESMIEAPDNDSLASLYYKHMTVDPLKTAIPVVMHERLE